MPWVRFDDAFSVHRKVEGLSDAAFRQHVSAVFWCARNLTDGFVPEDDLELVCARVRSPERFAAELVRRGLWHRAEPVTRNGAVVAYETGCDSGDCAEATGPGWVVHDYLEFQPSKVKVKDEQSKNAERQRRYRERQAAKQQASEGDDQDGNGVTDASRDASHERDRNGVSNGEQTPPRPDPSREEAKASSTNSVGKPPPEKSKRGTRVPVPFVVDDGMRTWAAEHTPDVDIDKVTAEFVDYWIGVSGQKGCKLDWIATWRNRMRAKQEQAEKSRPRNVVAVRGGNNLDDKHAMLARARQRAAELDALEGRT